MFKFGVALAHIKNKMAGEGFDPDDLDVFYFIARSYDYRTI